MLKTFFNRSVTTLGTGIIVLLYMMPIFSLAQHGRSEKAEGTAPNIILIVAESHRAKAMGSEDHSFVQTPHLDQLAWEGAQFENAYVTSAICVISRASILSGQHVARHGINDFADSFSDEAFQQTFPMLLKDAGYRLGWLGWYGVGRPPSTDDFDLWDTDIPWEEQGVHHTDNITQQANHWLESQTTNEPFFLQINYSAAHEIDPTANTPAHFLVQERYQDLYTDQEIRRPASADPTVWAAFPDFFRSDENIARARWKGFFDSDELMRKSTKDYYRLITGLDEAVGHIRSRLEGLGLAENTVIIYTSDHGFSLGEHGLMGKWYPFEQNIRVPLLIYHPADPAAQKQHSASLALNIDIAPTILDIAGVEIPSAMQGENLMSTLQGHTPERLHFFYEHTILGSPLLPATQAIVSQEMKYIVFPEHNFEMLYDLKQDPGELHNLAQDPRHQQTLVHMRQQLQKERSAAN